VRIEGEHQDAIGDPWWHPTSTDLLIGEHPDTCCLRFIDAYGDTTFNQAQIPVLIAEIQSLSAHAVNTEVQAVLGDLLAFLSRARDQPHVYVRFLGD
jgi:hypothetical protein